MEWMKDSLANLVKYSITNSLVTPEMMKHLVDLESILSEPDDTIKDMDPFSSADIELYFSNWVLLVSRSYGNRLLS